jgi:uncharacterized LabA/DUF88 family protein
MSLTTSRLAVLIDAENVSASFLEPLLEEIAKYGTANVKRIYGDWTSTQLNSWKEKLNKFAIQPIQQFRYTTGKNCIDSVLIIDAMDLLYTNKFDGFCIVSSDSDFTRLASRIRESGLVVYGFGEKQKTPEAFVAACNKFIYVDILDKSKTANQNNNVNKNKKLLDLLKSSYEAISVEDGWVNLGQIGGQLNKISPSFDPRNYGYKKLSELVKVAGIFEVKMSPHIYIKLK